MGHLIRPMPVVRVKRPSVLLTRDGVVYFVVEMLTFTE